MGRGSRRRGAGFLQVALCTALVVSWPTADASATAGCTVPVLPKITHSGAQTNPQLVYLLDTGSYPAALCNDGSPGGYVFRPGTGNGVRRWVMELQGGGFCETNASCATRDPSLTSTAGLISGVSRGQPLDGVLSPDPSVNPDFYDANAVRALYCSSDFWTGDRAPQRTPFNPANAAQTWYFRGRAIAKAVLRQLLVYAAGSADELLLTGDSAGGVGIVLDDNDLVPLVPSGVRTLVAGDAGFTLDIGAYDPNSPGTGYVSRKRPTPGEMILSAGHRFWGGRGDRLCSAAALTQTETQRARCYNTADVISDGYVPAPVATDEALDDTAQLGYDGLPAGRPKAGTPPAGYATSFAQAMTTTLQGVGTYNSVYAPYAFLHQMFTGWVGNVQAFDVRHAFPSQHPTPPWVALGAWYLDPCNANQVIGATLGKAESH